MNETKSVTKDPVCGMTVDEAIAVRAERDGKTYYFAAKVAGRSFSPRLPAPSRTASLAAAVDKSKLSDRSIAVAATNKKQVGAAIGR